MAESTASFMSVTALCVDIQCTSSRWSASRVLRIARLSLSRSRTLSRGGARADGTDSCTRVKEGGQGVPLQ